jgi:hypothetical protein
LKKEVASVAPEDQKALAAVNINKYIK